MIPKIIWLQIYTASLKLLEVLAKAKIYTEKRLVFGVFCLAVVNKSGKADRVLVIRSESSLANEIAKKALQPCLINSLLDIHIIQ